MNIVVFGCGRIGTCILDRLSTSEHEISVIDTNEEIIERISSSRDVMAICGDATNFHVLEEINIGRADVVIACTNANEANLTVCHVAKSFGAKHTIAQIRKSEYSLEDVARLENMFNVDYIYNPDIIAAQNIFESLDIQKMEHDNHYNTVRVMLMGGSRIAVHLCNLLVKANFKIKLLEKDPDVCERLCALVPSGVFISCADGTEKTVLFEEGIDRTDAFIALTDIDEQNLLISVYAESRKVPTVITKVKHNSYSNLVDNLGLKNIISPKTIAAQHVAEYIEGLK